MALKARLRNSLLFGVTTSGVLLSMHFLHLEPWSSNKNVVGKDYFIDTSGVEADTVLINDSNLLLMNGVYLTNHKRYSGIIKELYPNKMVKNLRSVYHGMLHGTYKSFYENGLPYEVRRYKNNMATGRHYAYWPDGKTLKFDFLYYEEKREGLQRKWYKSGKPYIFSYYTDDHEDGLQRGWRENGKLYLNYVAKDGHTYGLQQTALCYTLIDEEIKSAK